ncbi:oligosaccharide flippase family protein [Parvularcula maris]|uniref:Oligosaccharide flippase family protein n=1 Tax=Parvularcula maris TaxID=2965077 RepID=A0A9X2LB96_9PROT|nr:oligosaccharide flippase family protein [Parvularcula maris]MCQ8186313.1 oligosaccharide flippase family protein [Parvularcula maris]
MTAEPNTEGLPTEKAQRMRLAVFYTLLSRPAVLVLTGLSVAVVARVLDPAAFGVYAIAYAVFGILSEIGLFGLKPFLVTREKIDRAVMARAVGTSLFAGFSLFLLSGAALFLLPSSFVPAGFTPTLLLFCGALFVQPLALASEAVLERRLRFGFISLLAVAASAVNAGVAIALVLSGWGIAGLAAAFLAEKLFRTLAFLIVSPEGRVRPVFKGERQVLVFGSSYSVSTTLPKISGFAILGSLSAILGLPAVGLYNRAETVVSLVDRAVMSAIKPTILPIFTTAMRSGVPKAEIYTQKLRYLTALLWPCFVGMIVLAEPLILTLLGDQWREAVLPAQVLLVGALAVPFNKMSLKLFVAFGILAVYTRIQVGYQLLRVASAAAGAVMLGLPGAALGLAAATMVKAVLIISALHRETGQSWSAFIRIQLEGALVAGFAAAGSCLAFVGPERDVLWQLLTGGAGAGIAMLLGLLAVRHPALADLLHLLRRRSVPGMPATKTPSFVR